MYTTRTTCRVCGSYDLTPLFSLGKQYVSDFPKSGEIPKNKVPIDLEQCNSCSLVQAKHTAPQDFMYSRFYWYRSGVTETMRTALRYVASRAEGYLEPSNIILDIGSNDGTLLRSYKDKELYYRVGVEPATNLKEEGSQDIDCFINDFWSYDAYAQDMFGKAKVVTALGMFYDLEDPNQFIGDIAKVLHKDGVFIAQLMCLQDTLEKYDVGNFAHEHLEFYTLESLEYLYRQHGLEIFDIERNEVNGGSYLIFAGHQWVESFTPEAGVRIQSIREDERKLRDHNTFAQFRRTIEANRANVLDLFHSLKKQGKSVWVYGASTKGNVLLQYYGLDASLITGAVERSPEKYGRVTVGTNIPIYDEEYARSQNPDYFLVLPYAFIDEFVEREQAFRRRGGRFIVPLPELRVI